MVGQEANGVAEAKEGLLATIHQRHEQDWNLRERLLVNLHHDNAAVAPSHRYRYHAEVHYIIALLELTTALQRHQHCSHRHSQRHHSHCADDYGRLRCCT